MESITRVFAACYGEHGCGGPLFEDLPSRDSVTYVLLFGAWIACFVKAYEASNSKNQIQSILWVAAGMFMTSVLMYLIVSDSSL